MVLPLSKYIKRDTDPTGNGWYGASRGAKKHKGLDLVCVPGELVTTIVQGTVTKVGHAYTDDLSYRYVDVKNDVYKFRIMYIDPSPDIRVGKTLRVGEVLGNAMNVRDFHAKRNPRYDHMKPHIHIECWKHGLRTDPEPILDLVYHGLLAA